MGCRVFAEIRGQYPLKYWGCYWAEGVGIEKIAIEIMSIIKKKNKSIVCGVRQSPASLINKLSSS